MATLELQPLDLDEAYAFIALHHRHHLPPQGAKFAIGLNDGEKIVAVVLVGHPVARMLNDGWTAEVTRLCTDGTKDAASKLYSAAWRAARAMGYRKLVTYILDTEPGTSLKAAGWKLVAQTKGGSWSCPSRPRVDTHPLQAKLRWEMTNEVGCQR